MGDKIAVDPEVIDYHMKRVEQVGRDVAQAVTAARSMSVGGGAFGLMCSFLVPPAVLTTSAAENALASVEQLVDRSVRMLRAAADDFAAYDESVSASLETTVRSLDSGVR